MKKFLIIILIGIAMFSGCSAGKETLDTADGVLVSAVPTQTVAPTPTPEIFAEYIFMREDKNPAELAVGIEDTYFAFCSSGVLSFKDIAHTRTSFGYVGNNYGAVGSPSEEDFASYNFFQVVDLTQKPTRDSIMGSILYSIRYKKNGAYRFKLMREEWLDFELYYYTLARDIETFLYTEDNVIYYIKNSDEVWAFDMAEETEQYSYDYVPEEPVIWDDDVVDVTRDYLLVHKDGTLQLTDKTKNVLEEIEIGEYGTLLDAKGAGSKIYMVFETSGATQVYSYFTKTRTFNMVYETNYAFDISLSAQGYMFETFYSADKASEVAIMIDSQDDSVNVIYDDEIIPTFIEIKGGNDEMAVYREKEINQLLYKGNMLFAYNLDGEGVNTMIFYTLTVPAAPEPTPMPTPTPIPESAMTEQQKKIAKICGLYKGTYQNKSGEMTLTMDFFVDKNLDDNIISCLVKFRNADGNTRDIRGQYFADGEIDTETGYVVFTGRGWLNDQPAGYEMLNFSGYIDSETFIGQWDRDYLTDFVLSRASEN